MAKTVLFFKSVLAFYSIWAVTTFTVVGYGSPRLRVRITKSGWSRQKSYPDEVCKTYGHLVADESWYLGLAPTLGTRCKALLAYKSKKKNNAWQYGSKPRIVCFQLFCAYFVFAFIKVHQASIAGFACLKRKCPFIPLTFGVAGPRNQLVSILLLLNIRLRLD